VFADDLLPDGRLRFDHLGVLVADLAHGRRLLSSVLGVACWTVEFEDPVNDVFVQFGRCPGGMCYETVAPRSALSPVRNALKRRVNIFNHVAYRVASLADQAACLRAAGFAAIADPTPAVAYDNRPIQFFANADGLLVELIEAPEHRHVYIAEVPPAGIFSFGGHDVEQRHRL
jgi:methylmalonyl-CoA/ethylmalonyl-CoA epimerase